MNLGQSIPTFTMHVTGIAGVVGSHSATAADKQPPATEDSAWPLLEAYTHA